MASLLWVVNLGCIDLNQWYARTDDVDRPDYLHFDLDPGAGAPFERVLEAGSSCARRSTRSRCRRVVKTTGSKGLHVYAPIVRGPVQKEVWTFAKALGQELAVAPSGADDGRISRGEAAAPAACSWTTTRIAWGRTLASVYSVRPHPAAAVSTPVTWKEVETWPLASRTSP